MVGLFVGVAGFLLVAVQALNQLITLAMERRFHANPASIGHAMGIIVLVTSVGCLPIAGLLDKALSQRFGRRSRPLIMGVAAMLAVPCAVMLVAAPSVNSAMVAAGSFLFATCTANALVPTMLQDLTPASLRARSFAIWSFVVSAFSAIGPLLAGSLSDHLLNNHLLNAIALTAIPALMISALCAVRSFRAADVENAPLPH